MVLARDMAMSRGQVQSRNIMRTITVLQLDSLCTSGQGKKLMSEANPKYWDLRRLHQLSEVIDRVLTMCRISRPIGEENAIKMVRNLVDGVVIREGSDTRATADQTSQDVFLDTAIDDCYVHVSKPRVDMEWCLGADCSN